MKFWTKIDNKMYYIDDSVRKNELGKVFFSADVLSKYIQFPSKYEIKEGYIKSLDDGWILQSCYRSSDNEIYCYLYDLSLIPNKEKSYWKSFNIKNPTGQQSFLTIKRDFYCEFENSRLDNLELNLKNLMELTVKVGNKNLIVWNSKENFDEMINEISIPLVEENKQYRDNFLLPLARLLVEGFNYKNITQWAKELNIGLLDSKGEKLKSLTILEKCLSHFTDVEKAKNVISPLRTLQKEKSARASHGGKQHAQNMIQKAETMLKNVTKSLVDIDQIIRAV